MMRRLLIISILGIAAMNHQILIDQARSVLDQRDSPEVKAALVLRCGDAPENERRICESDLRHAFERGTSDADAIVRLHCTRFENGWVESQSPSPICKQFQEG